MITNFDGYPLLKNILTAKSSSITKITANFVFLDLVRRRPAHIFLDFRFLLHAGVSDGRPAELRAKIFHSHRSSGLRFCSVKGHSFRKTAGRWGVHLRIVPRRSSLRHEHDEARRVLAEDPLRYCALRKPVKFMMILNNK
jgi:hypothetical protein